MTSLQEAPSGDTPLDGSSPTESVTTIDNIGEGDEVRPLPVSLPEAPERQKWETKTSYILALVGYSVGFGNVWRFPFQMRENGGLAFLIPYFSMLALVGIPLYFLEVAVGQRRRRGLVTAWVEVCPALGGIGFASGWSCFMVGLYYNTLMAYCLSYFFDSFTSPLPWTNCSSASKVLGERNEEFYNECKEKLNGLSTKFYWNRRTLDISVGFEHIGNYNWYLFLYHVIAWVAVYIILLQGTKSFGMMSYVNSVLPYIVLAIFFIATLVIEPSKGWLGAYRLTKPKWSALFSPITWLKAGTQVFYSLGVAYGCLIVYASYSPAKNNCYTDAISVSLINCGTSLFAAIVVFPMVGLLGYHEYEDCVKEMLQVIIRSKLLRSSLTENKYDIYFFTNAKTWSEVDSGSNNITIRYGYGEISAKAKPKYQKVDHGEDVWEVIGQNELHQNKSFLNSLMAPQLFLRDCSIGQEATKSGGGNGFVFLGFTEAFKFMPGSNFWSVLFFLMLLTLGIDSGFGTIEGIIAVMQDLTYLRRITVTSIVCGIMTFFSLIIFPFGWGSYVLELLDQWTANWTFLVIALLECIAVAWVYGLAKISYDIRLMTGSKPSLYILLCWKYISPATILLLLGGSIAEFIYTSYESNAVAYTAFNPDHQNASGGEVKLPIPVYSISVGFLLMLMGISWIPVHYFVRNTKWNLLRKQAPNDFPEDELREERHIKVDREEDQFTDTEKFIIGTESLRTLQVDRDMHVKHITEEGSGNPININSSQNVVKKVKAKKHKKITK